MKEVPLVAGVVHCLGHVLAMNCCAVWHTCMVTYGSGVVSYQSSELEEIVPVHTHEVMYPMVAHDGERFRRCSPNRSA